MNRLINYFIVCLLLITIVSCKQKSKQVMSKDKMTNVLYDIHIANGIYGNNYSAQGNNDNTLWKETLIASVLEKHSITLADYDSSLVWYSDNVKELMVINDSIASRLKINSDDLMKKRITSTTGTDYYILPNIYHLNSLNPTLSFNLDSVVLSKLDLPQFTLAFDVQGVSNDMKLTVGVYYKYKDTLVANIEQIVDNKHYTFNKPQMADSLLKSVTGYFHLRKKDIKPSTRVNLYNIVYQDSTLIVSK